MTAIALFASTLLLVMALGAQSLLVNNGRYLGGGPVGVCLAMYFLRHLHRRPA